MSNSKKTSPQQLTVRIKECKNSGDLNQLLSQQGAAFDHIHVSAAWSKFKSMHRGGDRGTRIEVVRTLQELTESQMPKMDVRGVSNILHAIAKAKAADTGSMKQLVNKLMAKATPVSQSFDPQAVANTVWALATMGVTPEAGLLRAMQGRATAVAGEFTPQEVANTVWAHACFGFPCGKGEKEWFEILASRLLEVVSKMEPKFECQVHQWLLTFDLEPSWDLSSLAQVNVVKQQLGERCRRSFVLEDPKPSDLQVDLALISRLTFSDRSLV